MRIWIDMPVTRFEAPHVKDLPGEVFAEFARCKIDFRAALDGSSNFRAAIRKAKKMDCYFIYPALTLT
jgi:hypothetical protein